MPTATSLKAGAAFLAGVFVAVGGAFVYFKTTDAHIKPVVQVTTENASPYSIPEAIPQPTATPEPAAAKPEVTKVDVPPQEAKRRSVFVKPRTTSRPVSLAVTQPKSLPEPLPVAQNAPPIAEEAPPPVTNTPRLEMPAPVKPQPQPHTVTIPAGTSIAVRLNEKLSTEHSFTGDTFRATLDTPIVMNGFIIADKGAKVLGKVVRAQKPGKFQGLAELSLTLTEIATTDGQRVRVETNESLRKGPSNTNEEVLKMGGGAALGAIIGAIAGGGKGAAIGAGAGGAAGTGAVLLGHGKPAVIDNETRLTFAIANPLTITEQLN